MLNAERPHGVKEMIFQEGFEPLRVRALSRRGVEDEIARDRLIDFQLIVVRALFGTQFGTADDVALFPRQIAQAIKKMRLAAAVFADYQLKTRTAVRQIAAQVFLFECS